MKILIILSTLILASVSYTSYAASEYSKPRYTLLDKDKKPVDGVGQFNDDTRCIHEAGKLPTGKYYCAQEPVPITVVNDVTETNNSVLLTWIAPIQNTDDSELTNLAGFNVYYGLSQTDLSTIINVNGPTNTQLEITGLTPNTYYFAVTAFNELGVESSKSDISTKDIN